MDVLVDECCPRAVAEALIRQGFSVVQVAELAPGASDDIVAALAHDEGRLIVTQDYDFGEMAVRQGRFGTGVVLIACLTLPPTDRAIRVAKVMAEFGPRLAGCLTVIELRRVRQRRLSPSA